MDVMVGVLLAAATAVLWGSREILLRKAFEVTKPVHSLLATIAATFIISLIAAFYWESPLWNRLTIADWALWAIVGVLHFPVAMALYYLGIDAVGASRTSVASNVSAIVTPFLGIAFLAELSTPNVIAGVIVTGAGIFTVSGSEVSGGGWRWQRGIVYALLAGLAWSVTSLLTRFGFAELRLPMTALTIVSGVALLPVALYLLLKNRWMAVVSDIRRSRQLTAGCLLSALGQATLFAALSFAPTILVVPTYSLKSLVTVLLAYAVIPRSERMNMRVILGAILAVAGIILINL